ncbi:hypothetical protein [Shewanella polaris]|uniref:Uncharacterized protein n=1 Tax=Shewanella polaris TaxID=2588449 RepID=A0A4Y5YDB4_9GAMM|nr:hypothetical protein [Shewanella polaris]QDE30506.1 hypothetical protein FH971_05650 [Shewanella polaris]
MNIIKLFRLSNDALKREDELNLAYLYGQKLNDVPHIINNKTRIKGVILRVLAFFYIIARKSKLSFGVNNIKEDVFIYAGTQNQLNSLIPTVEALIKLDIQHALVLGNKAVKGNNDFVNLSVSLKVLFVALLLFLFNVVPLYLKLKSKNKEVEIEFAFNFFCEAYLYIPVFLSMLEKKSKCNIVKLIVMSNDHNVDNRCLRLIGEVLNIKTLYMQHASVSELFPPLKYDYALLDGQMAFNTYLNCSSKYLSINNHQTDVFLSGQKKAINFGCKNKGKSIGIAVNILDDIDDVLHLVNILVNNKFDVVVRTHPGQKKSFVNILRHYIVKNVLVTWSNSKEDSLINFFSSVSCVIAANTSIHLEAALANLATIYYEFSKDATKPDYYGYVKNGVSFELNRGDLIRSLQEGINYCNSPSRNQALKSYSESYATKWEHREGVLAALLIKKLLYQQHTNDLFYRHFSNNIFSVYKIKS